MKTTKRKSKVGLCKGCKRRVVLGRCTFKGGGINKMDHCRRCCDAPDVLGWKPQPAATKASA